MNEYIYKLKFHFFCKKNEKLTNEINLKQN